MKKTYIEIILILIVFLISRTLSNAQITLFEVQDGTTSLFQVDTNGDLTLKGKVKNGYAEMYVHENSTPVTISQANTWFEVDVLTQGQLSGFTFSGSSITASEGSDGIYVVIYSMTGQAGAKAIAHAVVSINDVIQTQTLTTRKMGVGGDVGCRVGRGTLSISANDVIKLEIMAPDGTGEAVIRHADIVIFRL